MGLNYLLMFSGAGSSGRRYDFQWENPDLPIEKCRFYNKTAGGAPPTFKHVSGSMPAGNDVIPPRNVRKHDEICIKNEEYFH